ncbi:hypothetical protein [Sulfitobacter sp. PS-8MA]|uniref:hypothetical protein n=1 Tax=Sulfitobacter sp. PS-8MA TaxID=3237707 RepID=UPI0034C6164A
MSELDEYQRRITAAMDRVAKGVDRIKPAPAEPDEDIVQALEEERLANAQLNERIKSLREGYEGELATLRDRVESSAAQMGQIDLDLQRVRQANEQLSEACEKLREANAEGLADPKLIDTAVIAELESLRATRAIEMAEIDAVLSALAPLVEETEAENSAPAAGGDAETATKTGEAH